MVVQHNMSALNTNRMLGITNWHLAKSAEKLASGYKINRAADDAAGLSISEKMRKKIRGLDKGMENVQDGISLCQVADGALNEVADMLQRIRELSIKAYNDTNSKSDRHIIQDEIGQCIDELDRVFETTKFNEIYIFRNGSRVQGEIFHPESYTIKEHVDVYRNIPDWLKIDDKSVDPTKLPEIDVHPGYLNGVNQDMTSIMEHDFKYTNDNNSESTIKLYFGSNQGLTSKGYRWVGDFLQNEQGTTAYNAFIISYADFMKPYLDNNGNYNGQYVGWTPQFDDNVSAKLNFSELANVSDPSNLYNMLSNLVGIELGFPCGTCNEMEAIRFSGYCEGMDNMVFYDQGSYVAKSEINLSEKVFNWNGKTYEGYFDAITDIIINNQSSQTANLAAAIVADLAKTTYDSLSSAMTTHYDRAIMDGTDPYSVYIYDYRDTDAIENDALDTFITTYGKIGFDYETVVEGGYYTHFDRWDSEQIWIQSGRFHFGSKNGRSRRILEKTGSVGSGGTRA